MMVAFYIGCGLSLIGAAFAPSLYALAVALFVLGIFAAIYHPVGTAMVIENATQRGRTLAFNGVCGNLGISLAAGITAVLTAAFSWRGAFLVPGVVCIATGVGLSLACSRRECGTRPSRSAAPDVAVVGRQSPRRSSASLSWSRSCAGLVFNTISVALPKIVDERVGGDISLVAIGGLTTAVFLCGAIAQMAVGRLVERFRLHILFAVLAVMQFAGVVWAAYATGTMLLVALAFTMAAIYGQITVNDLVIARYTADAWRGRVYAVRYFLTFMISGVAVSMIAILYGRGGFDLVLGATAFVALGFLIAVLAIAFIANGVENARGCRTRCRRSDRALIARPRGVGAGQRPAPTRWLARQLRSAYADAGCRAASAIAISAAPPNTILMPTRRPSAQTAVPGSPAKMMAARMRSMMPLTSIQPQRPVS